MAANEVKATIVGTVGKVGEKREVGNGDRKSSLITLRVVVTPRIRDESGEWKDDDDNQIWYAVKAWRRLADNAEASFKPGDRVFAYGTLRGRAFTTKDGTEVSPGENLEIDADFLGHEIGFNPAVSERKPRSGGSSNGGGNTTRKAAPKKTAPKVQNDDLDFGDDDDDDIDF